MLLLLYVYRCGTNEQCCNNKCTSSSSTCSCSYDYQCQISEQCCNSKCISSSSSCTCSVRRTTTNVDRARSAVIANASVVRLLVTVRTTPIVTLERIVVGEFVRHHTVVGVAELLQALLSAQLYSSPSSFPLCPVSAVLVARTTAIVHPVLWSSPANSHNNKWSQLTHLTTQQVHVPPSVNYNQPPPAGYNPPPQGFNQAPPPYPSYPPPPNQYPPPPGQAQAAPILAAINSGQPSKFYEK